MSFYYFFCFFFKKFIIIRKSINIINTFAAKQAELLENSKNSKIKHKKSFRDESKLSNISKNTSKSKEDLKKPEEIKKSVTGNLPTSEDSHSLIIKKLKLHELEREITNLRTIIGQILIPKLSTLDLNLVNIIYIFFIFVPKNEKK